VAKSPSHLLRAARFRLREGGVDGQLERWRERIEDRHRAQLLERVRGGRDVCWEEPEDEAEPLVTVRIPTFNRATELAERALPSALAQDYERLDILVIGDATDRATERFMSSVRDPRVRFVNLPRQGIYPLDPVQRWRVSGSEPMNAALMLAQGSWITLCDDDDEMTPDHVSVLLQAAKSRRLEFVHSITETHFADGVTVGLQGRDPLTCGQVTQGSVLYSMGLRFMTYSTTCYKIPDNHDWNLFRRMEALGVRMGFVDHVTYRYWAARSSMKGAPPARD
jgi:glycosyltransferase involved in cell wall biosynthesis